MFGYYEVEEDMVPSRENPASFVGLPMGFDSWPSSTPAF